MIQRRSQGSHREVAFMIIGSSYTSIFIRMPRNGGEDGGRKDEMVKWVKTSNG
jgi:hypothetical protein